MPRRQEQHPVSVAIGGVTVAAMGFHFRFPLIFGRAVMLALFAAILICARDLKLFQRVVRRFSRFRGNVIRAVRGLVAGVLEIWRSGRSHGLRQTAGWPESQRFHSEDHPKKRQLEILGSVR